MQNRAPHTQAFAMREIGLDGIPCAEEANAAELAATGRRNLDTDFGRFTASAFFLYRSQLRPTGSVYTKLAEFPFSKR